MAKVSGALLSFGATGQVGKTAVYSTWRGVPYARRHVTPANPKSAEQTKTRSVFAFLSNAWKLSTADFRAPWTAAAKGQPYTDRNRFMGMNTAALREGSDLTGFVGSPGANGGLSAQTITVTGSSGTLTVTLGAPALPTGWTISKAVAVAIKAGDPHTLAAESIYSATDVSSPYAPAISVPAGSYEVAGWFVFAKPDGSLAYGPSISGGGTAT